MYEQAGQVFCFEVHASEGTLQVSRVETLSGAKQAEAKARANMAHEVAKRKEDMEAVRKEVTAIVEQMEDPETPEDDL